MKPLRHNQDVLSMASRNQLSEITFKLLDRVQNEQPELQVFSAAILFAAICQRLRINPGEMHDKALKVLNPEPFDRSGNERFRALLEYARSELYGADA